MIECLWSEFVFILDIELDAHDEFQELGCLIDKGRMLTE